MPTTWAEWRNAMVAVKKVAGPGKFAIFLPLNEWPHLAILGLQAGSPLLKDNDTAGDFQSPQFRRALAFYLDLFKSELAPSVTNNEIANLYQEFGKGYFSMYISGPWNLGEFKRRLPPEQQSSWATAPLPGPDSTTAGVSLAGGSSLVVYAGSPYKEAAWKLVRYLSRPEVQLRFYHATGDLPAREEAWNDTSLVGDPNMRTFGQQLKHVVPTPKVPEWELIATRLQERSELVVRGAATPDSVLAQLDRDVARILEKRRWMLAKRGVLPRAAAAVNP
jgi:multiple sugar transport system substrate-binding protein